MKIKYGNFYISNVILDNYEIHVNTYDKAMEFDTEADIKRIMDWLGIENYEVVR